MVETPRLEEVERMWGGREHLLMLLSTLVNRGSLGTGVSPRLTMRTRAGAILMLQGSAVLTRNKGDVFLDVSMVSSRLLNMSLMSLTHIVQCPSACMEWNLR